MVWENPDKEKGGRLPCFRKKLSDDDALALVLSGLKSEILISDLCRNYGVSNATYYKLRD